jgi:uncharacterized membrane protein
MNLLNFLLVIISESGMIVGQIFFKHATSHPTRSFAYAKNLLIGIASMTIYFFVWLALLKKFELSYLFPFDGINRVILVLAAAIFLKEKATLRIWLGVILITAGVMLVSRS